MNVYDINDTDSVNVLLTGDIDFVLEFAGILRRSGVSFSILPTIDAVDELEMEMEFESPAFTNQAAEDYGEYAEHVVWDLRAHAGAFSHIVDLSITTQTDHRVAVEVASSINPKATVMVSVLNSTATEFGMFTNTAHRVIGLGLAPNVMSTVTSMDMSAGLNTQPQHVDRALELLRRLGYTVEVVEDRVGLVQMRVLAMLINEAAFAVMEGLATAEDIDKAMMLGVNYPKGLLAWADEIGIGVITLILDGLRREYEQERYRPCVLLKQMMRAGWSGKASGRGFYVYE